MDKRVLDAFGITGKGIPLEGGQNESMLYGEIVLKPVDNEAYYSQVSEIFDTLQPTQYRISRPIKTQNGDYVSYGYGATKYEPGHDSPSAVADKLTVARVLNKDLATLGIIELPVTDDQWTKANNVLWRCQPLPDEWPDEWRLFFQDLIDKQDPIENEYQIIHGDLGGNILFHETLKPLVIDFSPTIAPAKYSEAILVCDSIAWGNQSMGSLDLLGDRKTYKPYIQRAILFRVITIAFIDGRNWDDVRREWRVFEKIWNHIVPVAHQ